MVPLYQYTWHYIYVTVSQFESTICRDVGPYTILMMRFNMVFYYMSQQCSGLQRQRDQPSNGSGLWSGRSWCEREETTLSNLTFAGVSAAVGMLFFDNNGCVHH